MRFFHPRPLYLSEVVTINVAIALLLVAKFTAGHDTVFYHVCEWAWLLGIFYLIGCQIATARLNGYFNRKIAEQEAIISEARSVFPKLERPETEEEARVMAARYEAALEAQREKMKAAIVRMHELIAEWRTYP